MVYECDRCHYSTKFKTNFLCHLNKKNPCPQEYSDVSLEDLLSKHTEIWEAPKKHQCPDCDKSFSHASTLSHHKMTVHHDEYVHNNSLRRPGIPGKYKCPYCTQAFSHSTTLSRHKIEKHPEFLKDKAPRKHHCTLCEKSFGHASTLSHHKKYYHTEEGKVLPAIKCPYCEESFIIPTLLSHHMKKLHAEHEPVKKVKEVRVPLSNTEKCKMYREKHKEKYSKQKKEYFKKKFACNTPHCPTLAQLRKYKGYCFRCYFHTFPDEMISRNYKLKENHVRDYIQETYPDEKILFDKSVGGCSRRRPDCFIEKYTHSIIIEVDEEQHTDYDTTCEEVRINELFTDLADRPIVFIRFNPDSYIDEHGKKHPSSFKYLERFGIPMIRDIDEWNDRLNQLRSEIDKYLTTIPKNPVTNVYLFYDDKTN